MSLRALAKQLVEEKLQWADRPDFGAALYDPPDPKYPTRRCDNCSMWISTEGGRCQIHRPDQVTKADDVCGFWVGGKPATKRSSSSGIKYVLPRNSGLENVPGGTKCGNCKNYVAGTKRCRAIQDKGTFARVEPGACCALWDRLG